MDILIVDDETLARQRLLRLLENHHEYTVVGEAANGIDAVALVTTLHPDIVLMDIRMPGMDGLEAARHIMKTENPPAIIFCTAYGEHALDAFDAQAVGYLLKPVKGEQLDDALHKAAKITKLQMAVLSGRSGAARTAEVRQHVSAKTRLGLELVAIDDIRCFLADHKYVTAYHTKGEVLIDDTLKELEDEFGDRFVRIHRNALVSLRHIEKMERIPGGHYCVRLAGIAMKPQVSRRHVTELRRRLEAL